MARWGQILRHLALALGVAVVSVVAVGLVARSCAGDRVPGSGSRGSGQQHPGMGSGSSQQCDRGGHADGAWRRPGRCSAACRCRSSRASSPALPRGDRARAGDRLGDRGAACGARRARVSPRLRGGRGGAAHARSAFVALAGIEPSLFLFRIFPPLHSCCGRGASPRRSSVRSRNRQESAQRPVREGRSQAIPEVRAAALALQPALGAPRRSGAPPPGRAGCGRRRCRRRSGSASPARDGVAGEARGRRRAHALGTGQRRSAPMIKRPSAISVPSATASCAIAGFHPRPISAVFAWGRTIASSSLPVTPTWAPGRRISIRSAAHEFVSQP